ADLRALRSGSGRHRRGRRSRARDRPRHRAGPRWPRPSRERGRTWQPLHPRAATRLMARVLIVDDDSAIRSHLAAYLADVGHDAEAAGDAITALTHLERSEFDAVLSDVRMAGMDGFTLLREIRRRWPETGVVLMTAYATVPDAVEAIRGGAYDYLVKPFSLDQVGLVLGRLLEVQTLRRENRTLRRARDPPPLPESHNARMRGVRAM